jgi:hypothetical protein
VLNAVHFGAKRKPFWCKTQCILVQNAVQNGAECEVKSINIHCKWYRQNHTKPLKSGLRGAKHPLKSEVLGVKSG